MRDRRKVCVVVASRANLARVTTVLEAVRDHPDLELQVIAAASALLERFGGAVHALKESGFKPDAKIRLIIEGQTPATMAKSTGLGLLELPTAFEMLEPDTVLTVADRFETMATAVAAAYMNILVAHTQGGEVSGSIDESVRHAVTKLSHIHFPATELSARRVVAMGEDPQYCSTWAARRSTWPPPHRPGLAHRPFLLVLQHPVTTEYGHGGQSRPPLLPERTNGGGPVRGGRVRRRGPAPVRRRAPGLRPGPGHARRTRLAGAASWRPGLAGRRVVPRATARRSG